jgi:hypothetical protein
MAQTVFELSKNGRTFGLKNGRTFGLYTSYGGLGLIEPSAKNSRIGADSVEHSAKLPTK